MKQILIITRITVSKTKDEFRRKFYEDRKEPVVTQDFKDLHLDIYSGFDLYDDENKVVAKNIQSKIDANASEVLMVIHSLEFKRIKSELINLQNNGNWEIREYSSTDNNYEDEIVKAFQDVLTNPAKVESINKLFSSESLLEAKLELLHTCVIPENIPDEEKLDDLLSAYSDSFRSFKKSVGEIKEHIERENVERNEAKELAWNNKEYIEALTKLRISLLGS